MIRVLMPKSGTFYFFRSSPSMPLSCIKDNGRLMGAMCEGRAIQKRSGWFVWSIWFISFLSFPGRIKGTGYFILRTMSLFS